MCTSCNYNLHINIKPFKCHGYWIKKYFNRHLHLKVVAWQKFLYISYGARSFVMDVLTNYRHLLLYICYDKYNLYTFVTSKCFLVLFTITFSMWKYYIHIFNGNVQIACSQPATSLKNICDLVDLYRQSLWIILPWTNFVSAIKLQTAVCVHICLWLTQ